MAKCSTYWRWNALKYMSVFLWRLLRDPASARRATVFFSALVLMSASLYVGLDRFGAAPSVVLAVARPAMSSGSDTGAASMQHGRGRTASLVESISVSTEPNDPSAISKLPNDPTTTSTSPEHFVVDAESVNNTSGSDAAPASPTAASESTKATVGEPSTASEVISGSASSGAAPVPKVVGNQLINANTDEPMRLLGVDATGTEDACVEGKGFAFGTSNAAEAATIATWHVDAVRVPLNEDCWLGINGVPAQYSGTAYQTLIENWVAALNQAGLVAILDLHLSAPGAYEALQQWPLADADHSITFWSQVASAFASTPSVVFDLFNEPFLGMSHPSSNEWSCWRNGGCTVSFTPTGSTTAVSYVAAGMQQLLTAVREAGATQPVMIGGLNWAGDPCGVSDTGGNGGKCMWLADEPVDSAHQIIASFHTYNWTACITVACWTASVLPVADEVPVVTGEIGERDCTANYVDQYMAWADENNVSYLGWAWQPAAVDQSCATSDLDLLSNWSGTPNVAGTPGAAIYTHLASLAIG
jgi:endoglucanase